MENNDSYKTKASRITKRTTTTTTTTTTTS